MTKQLQKPKRRILWPVMIVLLGVSFYFGKHEGTGDEAKQRFDDAIRREVPPAATRSQVEAWFDQHGIDHAYFEDVRGDRRGVPGKPGSVSMAEFASLREEDLSGMVRGTIHCPDERARIGDSGSFSIYFFFDKQQTCVGHLVDWLRYSL